jgi:hypothetical protein
MASTGSNSKIAQGSTAEPEAGPPLLQMYSAKMTGTDRGLKRRLPNKKGIAAKGLQHGKLSSFHIVEQLLHAGRERHAPVAAIGGPALMFQAEPGPPPQGQRLSGHLCFRK